MSGQFHRDCWVLRIKPRLATRCETSFLCPPLS
jgi:hypothetical protein